MRIAAVLLCSVIGCSSEKMDMMGADEASMSAAEADTGSDMESGVDFMEDPAHWRMSGTLLVNDGSIQSELSFLHVAIMGDAGSELCSDNIGISSTIREGEVPEAGVQAWWRVTRTEPDSTSCFERDYPMPLPKPVFVGLGAMHPEIEAVIAGDTESARADGARLRSVYASMEEDSDVWVFGVAETSSEEEVEIDPTTGGVSVDGNWKFEAESSTRRV